MAASSSSFQAYRVECLPSGDTYIGITRQGIKRRWRQHVLRSGKDAFKLARSIAKYGADAFRVEHIASSTNYEDLLELEKLLIEQEKPTLNLTAGGEGFVGKHSEVSRNKMSKSREELWQDENYRSTIRKAQSHAWKKRTSEQLEEHRSRASINIQHAIAARKAKLVAKPSPKTPSLGKGYNMRIKTHCPQGHPYDEDNTFVTPKGSRVCRTCKKATRNLARDRRRSHRPKDT